MSVLVIAEHDQNNIKVQTQVAVAAAKAIGATFTYSLRGKIVRVQRMLQRRSTVYRKYCLPTMRSMAMPWPKSWQI